MANGKIRFGKQSGGQLALVIPDGVSNTEVIIPESGELVNKDYADLKQSKSELAYNVNTSSYIPNTLANGAIIERSSNANGEYVKFADGTLICTSPIINSGPSEWLTLANRFGTTSGTIYYKIITWTFPIVFISTPVVVCTNNGTGAGQVTGTNIYSAEHTLFNIAGAQDRKCNFIAIGRWK